MGRHSNDVTATKPGHPDLDNDFYYMYFNTHQRLYQHDLVCLPEKRQNGADEI